MDSSSQNWLGFSLSNHHMQSDTSHLSLFGAFNSNPSRAVDGGEEEVPKLEDFLGGAGVQLSPFSGEAQAPVRNVEMYDSELKTIFLRGLSTEQTDTQKRTSVVALPEPAAKKAIDTFGQRTSIYRGVTRHRWTGRYEAHLWDNSCRREGQSRKGRQVYLGGYDKEEKAARAYDLAALKYWGPTTTTNFPVSNYKKELEEMKNMTRQEFVASLRRKSSGFSRGASMYRGVTRHHQHGRWQARIGRVAGNKDLYLGTFSTQEEAAEAYDIAAIKFRGLNAVTNFDMSRYDVKSIANSNLPIGGITGKPKTSSESAANSDNKSIEGGSRSDDRDITSAASTVTFATQQHSLQSNITFALPIKSDPSDSWSSIGYHQQSIKNTNFYQASANNASSAFNMDFFANGSGFVQQESGSSNPLPFATAIALNSNNSYEGAGFGNWVTPSSSLHSFQSAKPNLSVFQTPIFGME